MSTRILFADDSVTAQNMGKRILTEAGYEVVAVSNGAAAVKKIAEQKPDIVILDLYMPGYSGLEVCEKIRGSMATLKMPVLLTVGKMEPYRPEDANRVRADGVIVKPFEASDLLAIIKKFEERIVPAPPPLAQQAEAQELEPELHPEPAEQVTSNSSQPTVDVPDHMASSAAFTDMLGMEPPPGAAAPAPLPAISYPSSTVDPAPKAITPEYELPVSWRREDEEEVSKAEIELPAAAAAAPEPPQHDVQTFETGMMQHHPVGSEINDVVPAAAPSRPLQIPVYQESAEAAELPEMLPTAAPPIGEIEIPRDPYLEETAAETTRNTVAGPTESGLIAGLQPEPAHAPQSRPQEAEMAPLDLDRDFSIAHSPKMAVDVPAPTAEPRQPAQATNEAAVTEADFETRVAAALASYNQTEAASPTAATEVGPVGHQTAPEPSAEPESGLSSAISTGFESFERATEPPSASPEHSDMTEAEPAVSAFEYRPPVGVRSQPTAIEPEPAGEVVSSFTSASEIETASIPERSPMEALHSHDGSLDSKESQLHAGVEAAAQALASATEAATNADRTNIAQAVSRAMERLKPELVDEILRELNSKE